jgi:ribosomal protein S18 acetylase RimI-like enzyme
MPSRAEGPSPHAALDVRDLRREDLDDVVRIDALHTAERKPDYWSRVFRDFLDARTPGLVGLVAEHRGRLIGYLVGDVRAFEFGSEPCGWVFAVGVDPRETRRGVASALLDEAGQRFRRAGVTRARTMVRRDDVGVLSFFRANGFSGGSFVQLEKRLEGRT